MALPQMNPAPANTYLEPTNPAVREDLAPVIYRIDPDETPFVTAVGHDQADQVLHEWLLQELNPASNVPQPEGFTAAISPAKKPVRYNNICQILARTVGVSETSRVVNAVGGDAYNQQLMLRGMEIKRDMELTLTGETVKTIADPRQLSGFLTWITNGVVGAGGTFPIGDGTNGHTAGTAAALTLDMMATALQQCFDDGKVPTLALMSSNLKRVFSTLPQSTTAGNIPAAQNIVQATVPEPVTVVYAVDVFRSDFGPIDLAPDRFMPAHVIELVSPDFADMSPLPGRDIIEQEYGRIGDATQGGVVWEGTLTMTAPKAHAAIFDLTS